MVSPDPRRWFTLVIVLASIMIVALDVTVLNVAIPTIVRDLHTDLAGLQWVIAGYSLTFASLLVIGGRLGDLYGPRRLFVIGAALFGFGSLIASVSTSIGQLIVGEAVIEGVGASLMMPATLGILSTTFQGRERATAFALWGATAGAAVAFGPLLGGFLTTNYSWRWAFRINVVVAPLAILGAMLFVRRMPGASSRERIDVPGALLVASGMFLLVFGLSEGGTYGWWTARRAFSVGGVEVWPTSTGISVVPAAILLSVVFLTAFCLLERWKERTGRDPLFEPGLLRHRSFRYGLVTTTVLAMGQLGFLFVLPVFLQDGKHLSALDNGLWLLPSGLAIILGTQIGARLTRRISVTAVVRWGLLMEAVGLALLARAIEPSAEFASFLPGLVVFGCGIGFASSQLTNVVLSEIPPAHAGTASGANTTVRQLGAALGIAVIGALLTTQTVHHAVSAIEAAPVPRTLQTQAVRRVRSEGVAFAAPPDAAPGDVATLLDVLDDSVAAGARAALWYAMAVVIVGAMLSWFIPTVTVATDDELVSETLDSLGPVAGAPVPSHPVLE